MLRVGLTGSIAVGKSFVAQVLRELGSFVLDADEIAREVVLPGTPGLNSLIESFGAGILTREGTLDRSALSAIVFNDSAKLASLNSLLHPLIAEEENRILAKVNAVSPDGIAVVEAALLIESGGYKRFTRLIVVTCEPDIQLERLMARTGWTADEALKRIQSQMPQEEKAGYADYVIDTTDGFEETRRRTELVFSDLQRVGEGSNSQGDELE